LSHACIYFLFIETTRAFFIVLRLNAHIIRNLERTSLMVAAVIPVKTQLDLTTGRRAMPGLCPLAPIAPQAGTERSDSSNSRSSQGTLSTDSPWWAQLFFFIFQQVLLFQ
jgi:hypothetical protein